MLVACPTNSPTSAERFEQEVLATNAIAIVEVAGRGKGVVATRDINDAELLVLERPLLEARGISGDRSQQTRVLEPVLRASFDALGVADRLSVMELACADGPRTLTGVFYTNAVPGSPSDVGLVCPTVSRFNHSCAPNASFYWVKSAGLEAVRALRHIPSGSEICVSYIELAAPTDGRQRILNSRFGFRCGCPVCTASDEARHESDARRERIASLEEDLCRRGAEDPDHGLRIVHELTSLLEVEQLVSPASLGRVACYAFQLAVYGGRAPCEVQRWAAAAYESYRKGFGEEDEHCQRMKKYMHTPPSLQQLVSDDLKIAGSRGDGDR